MRVPQMRQQRRKAEEEARCEADLAVIAKPSGGHGSEAIRCLEAGLHVVVDKPMCQGVREADAMMGAARRAGRILTCYHPCRFDPLFSEMRRQVNSGVLGRIVEIRCEAVCVGGGTVPALMPMRARTVPCPYVARACPSADGPPRERPRDDRGARGMPPAEPAHLAVRRPMRAPPRHDPPGGPPVPPAAPALGTLLFR